MADICRHHTAHGHPMMKVTCVGLAGATLLLALTACSPSLGDPRMDAARAWMRDGAIAQGCPDPERAETPRRGDLEYGEPSFRFHGDDGHGYFDVPVTGPGVNAVVVVEIRPDRACVATVNAGD
ncbi:hypothetical protein [Microbacterium lacticum]